jgi:hypothetical protein
MAVPSSVPVSLVADIVDEFGGSAPYSLTDYYRNGDLVPTNSTTEDVPTIGAISLTDFLGATDAITWTTTQSNAAGSGKLPLVGYSDGLSGTFGSVSDNSIDFLSKTYKALWHRIAGSEVGTHFQIQDNSTAWTSITIAGTTIARTSFVTGANGEFWLNSSTNYVGSNGADITVVLTQ